MLQSKIFLSDSDGDSSQFCSAADYFNAWVKDNPNLEIKDVKFRTLHNFIEKVFRGVNKMNGSMSKRTYSHYHLCICDIYQLHVSKRREDNPSSSR